MIKQRTYAEANNRKTFNWNVFLNHAITGLTNDSELQAAKELSNDWVTCACGNQCEIIPRDQYGKPKDNILRHLGSIFSKYLYDNDFDAAKSILQLIEKRSAELIAEIEKEADNG